MKEITVLDIELQLLPEKAVYVKNLDYLLVADLHLGKSETFQNFGIPIPNRVNQMTLDRLKNLCDRTQPKKLIILGDLFHSKFALVDEVLQPWANFLNAIAAKVELIIGNHDRNLINQKLVQKLGLSFGYTTEPIQIDSLRLTHEPQPQQNYLNICGHVHPCLRIKTRLDRLRLPCFYLQRSPYLLLLPSFGEFTGGYEVEMQAGAIAYAIAETAIIPFESSK